MVGRVGFAFSRCVDWWFSRAERPRRRCAMEDMVRLFVAVGIEPTRAKETCSNGALSTVFKDMIFKVRQGA